ncbi:hypothetical protein EYF80_021299 [Liparis tanakae]|uniref:Uncharacterized protein n=1 Tax=Liparis tanakae TaxID=230148 RepID=A0A4Z2HU36_9TELE|nr:hypothetical protein EYF80_021299 [Liparis tanakae]
MVSVGVSILRCAGLPWQQAQNDSLESRCDKSDISLRGTGEVASVRSDKEPSTATSRSAIWDMRSSNRCFWKLNGMAQQVLHQLPLTSSHWSLNSSMSLWMALASELGTFLGLDRVMLEGQRRSDGEGHCLPPARCSCLRMAPVLGAPPLCTTQVQLCEIVAELLDTSFSRCGVQTQRKIHKTLPKNLIGCRLPLHFLVSHLFLQLAALSKPLHGRTQSHQPGVQLLHSLADLLEEKETHLGSKEEAELTVSSSFSFSLVHREKVSDSLPKRSHHIHIIPNWTTLGDGRLDKNNFLVAVGHQKPCLCLVSVKALQVFRANLRQSSKTALQPQQALLSSICCFLQSLEMLCSAVLYDHSHSTLFHLHFQTEQSADSFLQPLLLLLWQDVSQLVTCLQEHAQQPLVQLAKEILCRIKYKQWACKEATVELCLSQLDSTSSSMLFRLRISIDRLLHWVTTSRMNLRTPISPSSAGGVPSLPLGHVLELVRGNRDSIDTSVFVDPLKDLLHGSETLQQEYPIRGGRGFLLKGGLLVSVLLAELSREEVLLDKA